MVLMECLKNLLSLIEHDNAIALDVGAYLGDFSQSLLEMKRFAEIHIFEPNVNNFAKLQTRFAPVPTLKLTNTAVSSYCGEADFFVSEDASTGSILAYSEAIATNTISRAKTPVITLDDYKAQHLPNTKIGLIKTDTQGNDLEVAKGAKNILSTDRPIVVSELIYVPLYDNQASPKAIEEFYQDVGYKLHGLFNIHVTEFGQLAFADGVFVPNELNLPVSHAYTQIDNSESYQEQIKILDKICAERLAVIEVLDKAVKDLQNK